MSASISISPFENLRSAQRTVKKRKNLPYHLVQQTAVFKVLYKAFSFPFFDVFRPPAPFFFRLLGALKILLRNASFLRKWEADM
jgi:hypothetical protein